MVVYPYFKINTFHYCFFDIVYEYDFVDVQMTKINALVL